MHHVTTILSLMAREEQLDLPIDPALFEDYLWMKLFDNTLAPSERGMLARAEFFATALGHENARSLSLLPLPFQRKPEHRRLGRVLRRDRVAVSRHARHAVHDPLLRRPAAAQPAHDRRAVAPCQQPCPHAEAQHGPGRAFLL